MGTVRRATPADAADLVRLRAVMLDAMGVDTTVGGWRAPAEVRFRELIAQADSFAAYVAEAPDGSVVASGAAWVDRRIPGPGHAGDVGHIASMATDPEHRGRGHGRAVFEALVAWLVARGVRRIDLFATEDGAPLYRAAGFREPSWPAMVWTHPDVAV